MKKIITIFSLTIVILSNAQAPNWNVNENNFEYSMSLVAFVNVNGTNLNSTNDLVGAFVNNELRGTTNLVYVASNNRYYAYLTIFSNANNEEVSFKVYNSDTDQVIDMPQTVNFEINSHYGDIFQAYSLASPALNNQAEIIDFNFVNANVSNLVLNDGEVILYVENQQDLTQLNATFDLSDGARLYNETTLIESSNNVLDFSNPIVFQVLSEDESLLKQWTVTVDFNASIGDLTYYKKDAVCYRGGEIKVTSTVDGMTAVLNSGATVIDSRVFSSGVVNFTGLEEGTYIVTVDGIEKEIVINLDE